MNETTVQAQPDHRPRFETGWGSGRATCDCYKTAFCEDCGQEISQTVARRHVEGGHHLISVGCDVCIPEA